jgi:hypothetical protein
MSGIGPIPTVEQLIPGETGRMEPIPRVKMDKRRRHDSKSRSSSRGRRREHERDRDRNRKGKKKNKSRENSRSRSRETRSRSATPDVISKEFGKDSEEEDDIDLPERSKTKTKKNLNLSQRTTNLRNEMTKAVSGVKIKNTPNNNNKQRPSQTGSPLTGFPSQLIQSSQSESSMHQQQGRLAQLGSPQSMQYSQLRTQNDISLQPVASPQQQNRLPAQLGVSLEQMINSATKEQQQKQKNATRTAPKNQNRNRNRNNNNNNNNQNGNSSGTPQF